MLAAILCVINDGASATVSHRYSPLETVCTSTSSTSFKVEQAGCIKENKND